MLALTGSAAGLFLGGLSKGALGVGLPLIAMPTLAFFMSVPQALVLLTVPVFITNIWQSLAGGHLPRVVRRFWPLTLGLVIGVGIGAQILVRLDEHLLYLLMGLVVLMQPAMRLLRPHSVIHPARQRWLAPLVGLIGGVIGGTSGLYGPPIMVYLAGLKLEKNLFAATAAFLFFTGGLALAIFLSRLGVMQAQDLIWSAVALIPAAVGIFAGQAIRARISQGQFDRAITLTMLLIGLGLLAKAF